MCSGKFLHETISLVLFFLNFYLQRSTKNVSTHSWKKIQDILNPQRLRLYRMFINESKNFDVENKISNIPPKTRCFLQSNRFVLLSLKRFTLGFNQLHWNLAWCCIILKRGFQRNFKLFYKYMYISDLCLLFKYTSTRNTS